jgi:hypothetical protein
MDVVGYDRPGRWTRRMYVGDRGVLSASTVVYVWPGRGVKDFDR